MSQPNKISARGGMPWGLVGMTVLVVAVELLLVEGNPECAGNVALSWKYKGRRVERAARERQVLCFGDSMVNFGVIPRMIETHTGYPAYNLAVHSGPAPASYFLFRRALESGAAARGDR